MEYIGYIFTALALIPAIDQIRYSVRRRSVLGLSGATTWAWVCSWIVWIMYGFLTSSAPVVLRNAVGLVPSAVLLFVYLRLASVRHMAPIALAYVAGTVLMLSNLSAGVLAIVALDIAFTIPSAVSVFRAKSVEGVSISASLVQFFLAASWFSYLCLTSQATAGLGWAVGALTYAIIVWKVYARRSREVQVLYVPSPASRVHPTPVSA